MAAKMFCRACGAKSEPDAKFCNECGAPVAGRPPTPTFSAAAAIPAPNAHGSKRWIVYIAGLVLVGGLGYLAASTAFVSKKIQGNVTDVYGDPIANVQIAIQKSDYKASTNKDGRFSLDYSPGTFNVVYAKEGFAEYKIELNIAQKTEYPAAKVILYPYPKEDGIYFIDQKNKRLVKIPENTRSILSKYEGSDRNQIGTLSYKIGCKKNDCENSYKNVPIFSPGAIQFIVRNSPHKKLHRIPKDSTVYYKAQYFFGNEDIQDNTISKTTDVKINSENLSIVSTNLSAGVYAWVPYRNVFGKIMPADDSPAATFALDEESPRLIYSLDRLNAMKHPSIRDKVNDRVMDPTNWTELSSSIASSVFPMYEKVSTYLYKGGISSSGGKLFTVLIVSKPKPEIAYAQYTIGMIPLLKTQFSQVEVYCKDFKFRENWAFKFDSDSNIIGLKYFSYKDIVSFDDSELKNGVPKLLSILCKE